MEKDLKAIKKSVTIVSGDKDVNELVTEYINKEYDCFGRAYLEGHGECRQCVIIAEFKDFNTNEFRRDPLWVVCFETCQFLSNRIPVQESNQIQEVKKEVEPEMPEMQSENLVEVEAEKKPEVPIEPVIEKPRRNHIHSTGHSKTFYRTCSKCGEKKSLYESTYNNAIKRYGSAEEMNRIYLCKKCRKEQ
jgi:hypothetical protein